MGARSIGIGHPRSGDRCTAPIPFPLDPARASPSRESPSRRPARGRGLLGMAIHRSSALRASTDAYGTGILRMPILLSELSIFGQNVRLVRLAGCTPVGMPETAANIPHSAGGDCPFASPPILISPLSDTSPTKLHRSLHVGSDYALWHPGHIKIGSEQTPGED